MSSGGREGERYFVFRRQVGEYLEKHQPDLDYGRIWVEIDTSQHPKDDSKYAKSSQFANAELLGFLPTTLRFLIL